jgi:hypothetical protein
LVLSLLPDLAPYFVMSHCFANVTDTKKSAQRT